MRIFFSGIGGSGVSAIASFMAARGHEVSGSDRAFDLLPGHPVAAQLRASGIRIFPQDGSGMESAPDFAVMSTAVEAGTPEVIRARALGVPLKTRPEYLAELSREFDTIAVTGTSGKSTASGLTAFLMRQLGMQPNFIGGGRVKAFKGGQQQRPCNFLSGGSRWLVMEACESDGTIVNYSPRHLAILNLELDHKGIEETARMFEKVSENTAGFKAVNADDRNLRPLLGRKGVVTFGMGPGADFRACDISLHPFGSEFTVSGVRFKLALPGLYNVYNALASIAVVSGLGGTLEKIAQALPGFTGIERRFDIHLNARGMLVIDDFAHNPHKISSLMKAVQLIKEQTRVCYVFQPHGFGPVRMMKNEYIGAFSENLRGGDLLILLPIFYQGGTVNMDISSGDLARGINERGKSAIAVSGRQEVLRHAGGRRCVVIMGARDETLSLLAAGIARRLSAAPALPRQE
ncbi:MAG: Mur ligase domain-containing protein [Nitrospiraceae bacterium]|nr:Mur ligase domain-containing protein [Nitrospiraceae bacterium]